MLADVQREDPVQKENASNPDCYLNQRIKMKNKNTTST